jgi:small conductance mechanosensitive channel
MEQFLLQWGPASAAFWVRLVWALAAFLLIAWLARQAQRAIKRNLERSRVQPNAILVLGLIIQYSILTLGLLVALGILGLDISALASVVGLLTVALSLSLQDILRNFIAGIYLLIERPFQIGDLIEVGDLRGVIVDVELRTTSLRNDAGERIVVPNLVLFTSAVVQRKKD